MPEGFRRWFEAFVQTNPCAVVSGGSWDRVSAQLGPVVVRHLQRVYVCNGNEMRENGQVRYRRPCRLPTALALALQNEACALPALPPELQAVLGAPLRPWLEQRAGMATLSWLPLQASTLQRVAFERWDAQAGVRHELAADLSRRFEGWRIQPAGQTSLDVFEQGADKSQVHLFEGPGPLWLVADAITPYGNDWTLAQALRARQDGSRAFKVAGWEQTRQLLEAWVQKSALQPGAKTLRAKAALYTLR